MIRTSTHISQAFHVYDFQYTLKYPDITEKLAITI